MIKAEIVAHSKNIYGDELISVLATFPRIILAEVNTHRMLSKNTSSSRAIPFSKMVEAVEENPFIPIAWQKVHPGMQGFEYFDNTAADIDSLKEQWLQARNAAVYQARILGNIGLTKQICNRLLEPFMWTTMLITGSKEGWANFFDLRSPSYVFPLGAYNEHEVIFKSRKEAKKEFPVLKNFTEFDWLKANKGQAEIHIMALAEAIYDAISESTANKLKAGEWHIPFLDIMNLGDPIFYTHNAKNPDKFINTDLLIKVSTAMAARTSYTIVGDEKKLDYKKMIELHDKLIIQKPLHASPMEHCARTMNEIEYTAARSTGSSAKGIGNAAYGWCRNFKGFIQYRHILEN